MAVPQRIKNRIIMWPSKSTSRYLSKSTTRTQKIYTPHAHSSSINNSQGTQTTEVSTDGWMDTLWHMRTHTCTHTRMYAHMHVHTRVHTHTCTHTCRHARYLLFSHKIRDEILPSGITWMDLEGIRLNEVSQRKKSTVWSLSHVESLKKKKPNKIISS